VNTSLVTRLRRALLLLCVFAAIWAGVVALTGGFAFHVGAMRFSSRSPRASTIVSLLSAAAAWALATPRERRQALWADWAHISRRQPIVNAYAIGLTSLCLLWAWQLYATWGTWGNLTIDSGREMYVPAVLAEGKVLYRDVWFPYTPAAPYFNSWLFRIFGTHLNVLYWAGSLSALGSAIFLFLIGMRLSAGRIGWTAGAVLILEVFGSSLFCFPLPYSFAAVYGCLTASVFAWVALNTLESPGWFWMFAAGSLAAVAELLKPEFGLALYLTLSCLIALRALRNQRLESLWRDVVAISPGIALCVLTIRWMVSIAGMSFITQENIMSWPTSYFMKTFGHSWLEQGGFVLSGAAIRDAIVRGLFPAATLLGAYSVFRWQRRDRSSIVIRIAVLGAAFGYAMLFLNLGFHEMLAELSFPEHMVFYVAIAAAACWVRLWLQPAARDAAALPVLLTFAGLLAFRILFKMESYGYAIYYNGPVVLSYLLVVNVVISQPGRPRPAAILVEVAICLLCVGGIAMEYLARPDGLVPLSTKRETMRGRGFVTLATERGSVWVHKDLAASYGAAIAFMKARAADGEDVLSIPEDTSLYFLSETHAATRVYAFTPGVMAPGKMTTDTLQEIERKHVRYLLWSNRTFGEYGVPVFGRDFDPEMGNYFTSHYRRVGPVAPNDGWRADVWERKPDSPFKDIHN
jgi:hypothetical protein